MKRCKDGHLWLEYKWLRELVNERKAAVRETLTKKRKNFLTKEESRVIPHDWIGSDCHSALEEYYVFANPEDVISAYIKPDKHRTNGARIITWTGQKLGKADFGEVYLSNFGDNRVSFEAYLDNGRNYFGTWYAMNDRECVNMRPRKNGVRNMSKLAAEILRKQKLGTYETVTKKQLKHNR